MKLYTDGGSLGKMVVYPDDTQDYTGNLRFSKYVAEYFNLEDCNYSENGGSNHRIARNLLEDISGYDAFIIVMCPMMRTEYYDKKWIGVRQTQLRKNSESSGTDTIKKYTVRRVHLWKRRCTII